MLTEWLDRFNVRWAELTGVPARELSTHLGGEGLAVITEAIAGWTTKGWLNKLVQATAGVIATGYGLFGRNLDTRTRAELLQFGAHEMSRAVPMNPEELEELRKSFEDLMTTAKTRGALVALTTGLRTPAEIARATGSVPTAGRVVVRKKTPPAVVRKVGERVIEPQEKAPAPEKEKKPLVVGETINF